MINVSYFYINNSTLNNILLSLRIIFMGTPQFAVASLDKLYESGFDIVAVITSPDKHAGRGLQLSESAIKKSVSGMVNSR